MIGGVFALVTEKAHRSHRPHFDALELEGHGLQWLLLDEGGRLHGPPGARPDIAWLSSDVFFTGLLDRFAQIVQEAPDFRWLQSAAAGVDLALYRRLLDRGVRICNAHLTAIPVAEFVLRAVLDVFQEADRWRTARAARRWEHHDFREVWQSRWLVVGLGAIGSETARRAQAFGAHVTGVRRHPTGDEPVDALISPAQTLTALPDCDVVVLAAPATPETENLVDDRFLSAMKPGSVLVNVARGKLVNDDALLQALDDGDLAAAVLDVFATEPLEPDHPYWTHPKVVMTPHSSGGGVGRRERGVQLFCDNLRRLLADEPLVNEVSAMQLPSTDLPFALGPTQPPEAGR
ncbi:D-2-hydroxyacid dehydrogenase [Candidatus Poriferisocius sp.]|uniref:D-2-hydroxyacid dehydrogenase n=1 Tax=Candidatus Poriferisocius sp. TaxID=3101276 RepID=UPI003B5A8808